MLLFDSLPFGSMCHICLFLFFFGGGGGHSYSFLDWPCLSVAILMSLWCRLILS